MNVTPSQFDLLSRLLDVAHVRHNVIAGNVANVNTPAYRRREVVFEDVLAQKAGQSAAAAAAETKPKVVEAPGGVERADGNNVDIDAEMGRLNKNTLLTNAYTQILANRLGAMRSAITGR